MQEPEKDPELFRNNMKSRIRKKSFRIHNNACTIPLSARKLSRWN